MKFISLVSIATILAAVLGHGDEDHSQGQDTMYKSTIKFDEKVISKKFQFATTHFDKVLTVKELSEKHADFFKQNPTIKQSIGKCFNDHPTYKNVFKKAMGAIVRQVAKKMYKVTPRDLTTILVEYTSANPEFLKAVQHVGIEVMTGNPTLVDDFFNTVENVVRSNPEYFLNLKKGLVEFSHGKSENTYKKLFKMVLDSASINPDFASHLVVHLTQVDLIACQSGSHNQPEQKPGNDSQKQYNDNSSQYARPQSVEGDFNSNDNQNKAQVVEDDFSLDGNINMNGNSNEQAVQANNNQEEKTHSNNENHGSGH